MVVDTHNKAAKQMTRIEAVKALVKAALELREKQAAQAIGNKIPESYRTGNQAAIACYEAVNVIDETREKSNRRLCEDLIELTGCGSYDAHWVVNRVRGQI